MTPDAFWYAVLSILWRTKTLKLYGRIVEYMWDRVLSPYWFSLICVLWRLGLFRPYELVIMELLRWVE
jgi:hypothetical protein